VLAFIFPLLGHYNRCLHPDQHLKKCIRTGDGKSGEKVEEGEEKGRSEEKRGSSREEKRETGRGSGEWGLGARTRGSENKRK
jgi:hypothetical protein